jgi:hypothetical protein
MEGRAYYHGIVDKGHLGFSRFSLKAKRMGTQAFLEDPEH